MLVSLCHSYSIHQHALAMEVRYTIFYLDADDAETLLVLVGSTHSAAFYGFGKLATH